MGVGVCVCVSVCVWAFEEASCWGLVPAVLESGEVTMIAMTIATKSWRQVGGMVATTEACTMVQN